MTRDRYALDEALALFNRKERYWLVRNLMEKDPVSLSESFRERLSRSINQSVPKRAWWAMDFHLDWLVAALHMVDRGPEDTEVQENKGKLVKGSQQDIDLVVAFDETLILIEAKATTGWSIKQLESKIERLSAILGGQSREGYRLCTQGVFRIDVTQATAKVAATREAGLANLDGR